MFYQAFCERLTVTTVAVEFRFVTHSLANVLLSYPFYLKLRNRRERFMILEAP